MVTVAASTEPSALAARLEDPAVAEALGRLLDHADLLAVLVVGLDGLIRRGDTVTDSVAEAITELRSGPPAAVSPEGLLDAARRAGQLVGPLVETLPTVDYLLRSDLGDTRVIDVAAMASRAVMTGSTAEAERPGLWRLWKALRDDDTRRALGFGLAVARAMGAELRTSDHS